MVSPVPHNQSPFIPLAISTLKSLNILYSRPLVARTALFLYREIRRTKGPNHFNMAVLISSERLAEAQSRTYNRPWSLPFHNLARTIPRTNKHSRLIVFLARPVGSSVFTSNMNSLQWHAVSTPNTQSLDF